MASRMLDLIERSIKMGLVNRTWPAPWMALLNLLRQIDTRLERIIEAAMELFWLKGYGSTSIADILSRSQVNSGSLYHFFPASRTC
jgi:hypothetical protein